MTKSSGKGLFLNHEIPASGMLASRRVHTPKRAKGVGNKGTKPRQRTDDLVVRAQGDETLIFGRRTDCAGCLPAEVTRTWNACTGTNTLPEIAAAHGIDEPTATSAVGQLMPRAKTLDALKAARIGIRVG